MLHFHSIQRNPIKHGCQRTSKHFKRRIMHSVNASTIVDILYNLSVHDLVSQPSTLITAFLLATVVHLRLSPPATSLVREAILWILEFLPKQTAPGRLGCNRSASSIFKNHHSHLLPFRTSAFSMQGTFLPISPITSKVKSSHEADSVRGDTTQERFGEREEERSPNRHDEYHTATDVSGKQLLVSIFFSMPLLSRRKPLFRICEHLKTLPQ